MDSLEYIDNYYQGPRSPEETRLFEQRILEDPAFAQELAFYLSSREAARGLEDEVKQDRFRQLYGQTRIVQAEGKIRKMWPMVAAAAVLIVIVFGIWMFPRTGNPKNLADEYIGREFVSLDVTMGKQDSMQVGVALYNEQQFPAALLQFESILRSDTSNTMALENAGKTAIRLGAYDKALTYFRRLENNPHLYANYGLFYEALTLMRRNLPGDDVQAKKLLQEIVNKNLEGKADAQQWLDKW